MLQSSVNYGLEFTGILYFSTLGQYDTRFFRFKPGGIAKRFLGTAGLMDFHEEGLDGVFLHASVLPEDAFGVNVNVEVPGLDESGDAGFFVGLAFRGLAVGKFCVGRPFGKSPFPAAVGID